MVLDKGLGPRAAEDLAAAAGDWFDFIKLGWGTALVTRPILAEKIRIYRQAGLQPYFGGTLFEHFFLHHDLDSFHRLLEALAIEVVEISNGTVPIPQEEKLRQIDLFRRHYRVLSEVGNKREDEFSPPFEWIAMMQSELDAGSELVITEARESGLGGICRSSGELRFGLIREIVRVIPPDRILFEAPNRSLQAWFISNFGSNVNLGNISPEEIISVETLRQGLRSETMITFFLDAEPTPARKSP